MARDPTLPIRAGYAVASVPSADLGNSLARTQRELGSGHWERLSAEVTERRGDMIKGPGLVSVRENHSAMIRLPAASGG